MSRPADAGSEAALTAGSIVGSYVLARRLGVGGFGTTWLARHQLLGGQACLKVPHSELPHELILREARVLWDLHHPSLPTLRDVLPHPDDGRPILVLRYVEGTPLADLVPLALPAALHVFGRLLRALRVLHHRGIVHGDVKPADILVEPDLHGAVLIDLGLATVQPDGTSRPTGWTPTFAAPETLDGAPPLPESDLYSLGLTMACALGGDVKRRVMPAGVPEEVWAFIAALTRRDPTARPRWESADLLGRLYELARRFAG